jgi:hypothetical protein
MNALDDLTLSAWEIAPILVRTCALLARAAHRVRRTGLRAEALFRRRTPRIELATWQCPACGASWLAKSPEEGHSCACTAEPLYICLTDR